MHLEKSEKLKNSKYDEATVAANIPSYYTTLIGTLDKGVSFLSLLGHFDFPTNVQAKAKEVTTSVLDLVDMLKGDNVEGLEDLGLFVDSLRDKYLEGSLSTKDAAVILEAAKAVVRGITPGMEKAVLKAYRSKCEGCGFIIPRYSGRYPSFCPECGEALNIVALKKRVEKKNEEWKEVASVIAEAMFYATEAKFEEGSLVSPEGDVKSYVERFGLKLREKSLSSVFEGDKSNLLSLALVKKIAEDEESAEKIAEKVVRPSVEEFRSVVEDMDSVIFASVYPLLLTMNEILLDKEDSMEDEILERARREGADLYEALSGIKAWTILMKDQEKAKDFRTFTEALHSLPTNIFESKEVRTEKDCEDLAVAVLGEDILEKVRSEVDNRPKYKKAVLALDSAKDRFAIHEVVKGFCSGLTRLAIQQEQTPDLRLEVFLPIVVEKMQTIFEGKREEPINFLKGVFIREKDRSK